MNYPTRIDLCDGQYSVIFDLETGQSECLHYGKKWRELHGDKMVMAMFDRIVELEEGIVKAHMVMDRMQEESDDLHAERERLRTTMRQVLIDAQSQDVLAEWWPVMEAAATNTGDF